MTAQTRRVVMTLAVAFISGTLASSFLGWLLVPARLSVDYLTLIVLSGSFVSLLIGGIIAQLGAQGLREHHLAHGGSPAATVGESDRGGALHD